MGMPMRNSVAMVVLFLYEKLNVSFPLYLYIYSSYKRQFGGNEEFTVDGDAEALRFRYYVRTFKLNVEGYKAFKFTKTEARNAIEYAARTYADFPLADADIVDQFFHDVEGYDGPALCEQAINESYSYPIE